MKKLILGIELGSTRIKSVLIDEKAKIADWPNDLSRLSTPYGAKFGTQNQVRCIPLWYITIIPRKNQVIAGKMFVFYTFFL